MAVNVLHNTHVKLKYNKINNLINKAINIAIIRSVIILTVCLWMLQNRELETKECLHYHFTLQIISCGCFVGMFAYSHKMYLLA